ncbi:adenosine deaminase [Pseudactinotalea sp. HY158]|uniref:adenosine deaminase n=1 Tax=Pseudactinotalea sp. HY158 TaxID=2654547 RepID=UPI00129C2E1B|nr:adenosine deaminase [Pseudactinotalea sp. HY158]QGH68540.1 adenosine deaminase [Pseudactinotalea sp. HY158]
MTLDTPPCAELHLHIEGTLEPEMVFALADRNRIRLDSAGPDELAARYAFRNLQSFLDLYYANMDVLRTEDDFADLTSAYVRRAAAGGVRHAEIMFDPQAHTSRGVPLEVSVAGVAHGLRTTAAELGMSTRLIAAFLRDRPEQEAISVLEQLLDQDAPIAAIGLDSAEVGNPPAKFTRLFELARARGLDLVAHAGEEGPPEYVWQAIDLLGVFRVDHGIRSVEDSRLVARLVADRTPLTVCPLSNVRLRAVDSIAAHPLGVMLEAGLNVSVNSDDPAYFGGYVDDNFRAARDGLGLGRDQLATLARNSIASSVLPAGRGGELLAEIDAWAAAPAD